MQALLNTAVSAVRKAGDTAARYLSRVHEIEVRHKARNEFVTQVDQMAENIIIEAIRQRYPGHGFLAEESGLQPGDGHLWIIDPLDGTTNFIHGFPVFSVSVALQVRGQLEVGVVYDPCRQELFTALRGAGAQVDGHRVRVSSLIGLEGALIGTGFPYRSNLVWLDRYMKMLRAVMEQTAGVRRPGSAALDLCYVAAGRLDGFWELGLKSWDIAAGALMIQEAGGYVSDLGRDGDFLESGNVVAGAPKVHDALKALLLTYC
jgi:myo-inositol-1(or 4)-monophosphatase